MEATQRIRIEGHVSAGFDAVRDAFAENFPRRATRTGRRLLRVPPRREGRRPVGRCADKPTGEPWQEYTMVLVYSSTKGLAAMTLALAHSRGWLDYEQRVCSYWPEFAQNGKETITVRQLLAHQAGLFAFDEPVDRSVVADLDRLAVVLARQKPAWEPGTRQAYHAITLGCYEGELLRRIDPHHRSLGQFFQDEIASPLGLDFYIRLTETIPDSRLATLARPSLLAILRGFGISFFSWRSIVARTSLGRSWVPSFPTTSSVSMPATSKCRPAGASARRAPSPTPSWRHFCQLFRLLSPA